MRGKINKELLAVFKFIFFAQEKKNKVVTLEMAPGGPPGSRSLK